jgi:hypothetical protein
MRRIGRGPTPTALFATGRVATPASSSADRASAVVPSAAILSSAVLPVSAVVAILGVLVLLTRPVALSASSAAGHTPTLDTHAASGGQEEH